MYIFLSLVHNLVKEICQVRCCMLIVDCVCVSDVSDVSDVSVLKLGAGRPAMQCCYLVWMICVMKHLKL